MICSEAITTMVFTGTQKGILFPIKSISNTLNGVNIPEIEENELKSQILFFISRNKSIQIDDISEYFKIHPGKVINILEKLEKEDKIKRVN